MPYTHTTVSQPDKAWVAKSCGAILASFLAVGTLSMDVRREDVPSLKTPHDNLLMIVVKQQKKHICVITNYRDMRHFLGSNVYNLLGNDNICFLM